MTTDVPAGFPLIVQVGSGQPRMFTVAFTIGKRGSFVLDDAYTSGEHAMCKPVPGGWVVLDLGSMSGTFVNDVKIWAETPLARGDRVKVGRTILTMVPA